MRALIPSLLLLALFISTTAYGSADDTPYVEISVNGLEEVAPPLYRLADAIEAMSKSENLSTADRQKVIAIIGELKTLGDKLDNTIQTTRQKVSQTQQEISTSIRQIIILTLLGLATSVVIVCAAVFILFRLQIMPLVISTSTSLEKFAAAMDNLSAASRQLSEKDH